MFYGGLGRPGLGRMYVPTTNPFQPPGVLPGAPERQTRGTTKVLFFVPWVPPIPPEPEDEEAFARWGGTENIDPDDQSAGAQAIINNYRFPAPNNDDEDDKEDDPQVTYTYTEVNRKTETVRVENPDDSDQYVMVERITEITFKSSHDKFLRKFVLNGWD